MDYAASIAGYSTTQIDAVAPPLPAQGDYDIYASALDGSTRVYSNPETLTVASVFTDYELDGAGNRDMVETNTETLSFTSESDTPPGPADDQMNQ